MSMMENKGFFAIILALVSISGSYSATFMFTNNCPYTVWPGTLTGNGAQLSSTGFELATGASTSLDAPTGWSGRFWARTGCFTDSSGKFTCTTADCASGQVGCNGAGAIPPTTLLEFTLNGGGNNDFYDTSLVDGYNLPASITPQGGSSGCSSTSCPFSINSVCPPELSVAGSDGGIIACKSACEALQQPQYCCTGAYSTPETCPPTNYSKIFKDSCPQAYSYAYDDKTSTFTCASGGNYLITFCP
ncbi:hypothetical protein MKW92_028931 [Papaver armeniacum]|nr:hypothetical protein MKW92_028931 [Papaver armeniacum]